MKNKPLIAISACLLGHNVRYDGRILVNNRNGGASSDNASSDKPYSNDTNISDFILQDLSSLFQFKAICPEVAIGLSVPRKPMHLIQGKIKIQAVLIDDANTNYTQKLIDYAESILPALSEVSAYIFKSKSPSCGVGSTALTGESEQKVNGIFAQVILEQFPKLPILDDSRLLTFAQRQRFIKAAKGYVG